MSQLLNHYAPDFMLPGVAGGHYTLGDWRGQIIVLNFWSAECPWSRRADVALVYRQLAWDPKGVRIVGIASNANETDVQMRTEAQARHVKYPILVDADRNVATAYQAKITPLFFVIDRQGYVRYSGALDDVTRKGQKPSTIYLDEAVQALLANRPPNPLTTAPFGSPLVYATVQSAAAFGDKASALAGASKVARAPASTPAAGAEPPPAEPPPAPAVKPPGSPEA